MREPSCSRIPMPRHLAAGPCRLTLLAYPPSALRLFLESPDPRRVRVSRVRGCRSDAHPGQPLQTGRRGSIDSKPPADHSPVLLHDDLPPPAGFLVAPNFADHPILAGGGGD